ncbi:MAG: hypothetical protein M3P18_16430 [Actinomycetota bacterium]|nr:hypothetical protein [Actinomycetota bacterium]
MLERVRGTDAAIPEEAPRLLRRILVVAAIATAVGASSADATTPLTKTQYNAMLKRASARVGKVESAAEMGLSSNATPARVRTLILTWANTETQLGRSFRAIQPPATAASWNALLARGEITFGAELAHAANNLPRKRAAIGAYLQRTLGNAKGAAMIDHALKKLKVAGYGASG